MKRPTKLGVIQGVLEGNVVRIVIGVIAAIVIVATVGLAVYMADASFEEYAVESNIRDEAQEQKDRQLCTVQGGKWRIYYDFWGRHGECVFVSFCGSIPKI